MRSWNYILESQFRVQLGACLYFSLFLLCSTVKAQALQQANSTSIEYYNMSILFIV
jgi:hypothetical protein